MRRETSVVVLLAISLLGWETVGAQAVQEQRQIAQQLVGADSQKRHEALEALEAMKPEDTGPELRAALATLLEREAAAHVRAYETGRHGGAVERPEEPELIGRVTRAVARLHDPSFVPALTSTLGTGFTAVRALVDFGEVAAPSVLGAVESTASIHYQVDHGLITLRMMLEQHPKLSPATRARIRRAAEQRLSGTQYFTTLWRAIELAIVSGDTRLRQIVSTLASDRAAVVARGITDPEIIDLTQKRARDRLAGIPPMPRK